MEPHTSGLPPERHPGLYPLDYLSMPLFLLPIKYTRSSAHQDRLGRYTQHTPCGNIHPRFHELQSPILSVCGGRLGAIDSSSVGPSISAD
jgi:hypothetical protein